MTFQELKTHFNTVDKLDKRKFQSEVYIQSIEILIAKCVDVKNHPHAIYCKNELIKLKNL